MAAVVVVVAPLVVSAAVHVRHIRHGQLTGVTVHLRSHGGLAARLSATGLVVIPPAARLQILPRTLVVLVETVRLRVGRVAA